jgi:hypothetical protein
VWARLVVAPPYCAAAFSSVNQGFGGSDVRMSDHASLSFFVSNSKNILNRGRQHCCNQGHDDHHGEERRSESPYVISDIQHNELDQATGIE